MSDLASHLHSVDPLRQAILETQNLRAQQSNGRTHPCCLDFNTSLFQSIRLQKTMPLWTLRLSWLFRTRRAASILHVVQAIDSEGETPDEETTEFYDHIRKRTESEMERISQRFTDAEVPCEVKVRVGDRLQEIIDFSSQHAVDLIIMSSHRIDPGNLAETWATLSYKVSVICDCPILLVK